MLDPTARTNVISVVNHHTYHSLTSPGTQDGVVAFCALLVPKDTDPSIAHAIKSLGNIGLLPSDSLLDYLLGWFVHYSVNPNYS